MKAKSIHFLIGLGLALSLLLFAGGNAAQSFDKDKTPAATSDNKITICHVPPGNTGNPQTITISRSAWRNGW